MEGGGHTRATNVSEKQFFLHNTNCTSVADNDLIDVIIIVEI